MAKRKLSHLIQSEVTNLQSDRLTDLQSFNDSDLSSHPTEESVKTDKVPELQSNRVTGQQTSEVPKYLSLIRKETRLREDQLEQLTILTRQLNRQRQGKGERITENTLIRIAVDLLLSNSEQLQGITEEELTDSVR